MKKVFKWVGIVFLGFIAFIMVYAFLGKEQTLNLQIGSVNLANIQDGQYTGEYDCYRWSNSVVVTVSDHMITDIKTLTAPTGRESIRQDLAEQIIKEQTLEVDGVSGATVDKKAFLKAVENALRGTQPQP